MLGVAAMATQNAVVRLALPGHPTTAVMSTNAAQLAVDLAMLARCVFQPIKVNEIRTRADVTTLAVLGFVVGVVTGAILEIHFGLWSLTFPSILAVLAIPLSESWNENCPSQLPAWWTNRWLNPSSNVHRPSPKSRTYWQCRCRTRTPSPRW